MINNFVERLFLFSFSNMEKKMEFETQLFRFDFSLTEYKKKQHLVARECLHIFSLDWINWYECILMSLHNEISQGITTKSNIYEPINQFMRYLFSLSLLFNDKKKPWLSKANEYYYWFLCNYFSFFLHVFISSNFAVMCST